MLNTSGSSERVAPYKCIYCGAASWIDPSDQRPPPGYCHEVDHGTYEDWLEWNDPPEETKKEADWNSGDLIASMMRDGAGS